MSYLSLRTFFTRVLPRPRYHALFLRPFSSTPHPVEVKSPGGRDGTIPTDEEQAVGKEYEEVMLAKKGLRLFNEGPIVGPFGTLRNPVKIPSTFQSRVIGCVGHAGHEGHSINFMSLKAGPKHACAMCGQIFILDTDNHGDSGHH